MIAAGDKAFEQGRRCISHACMQVRLAFSSFQGPSRARVWRLDHDMTDSDAERWLLQEHGHERRSSPGAEPGPPLGRRDVVGSGGRSGSGGGSFALPVSSLLEHGCAGSSAMPRL